jgi:hypothetical protein
MNTQVQTRKVFCIYINTILDGAIPVERDDEGNPFVYVTEEEAQRVIAEDTIERLRQFLDGEREFDDAVTVDEYVMEVDVFPDGSITDERGRYFGHENW